MTINTVLVLGFTGWILRPTTNGPDTVQAPRVISAQNQAQAQRPAPTRADILAIQGTRFGLSTPQAPWSSDEINRVAKAAGAHPTLIQFFVKWTEQFRPDAVPQTYKQGALPVISWEPWAGTSKGTDQPDYALSKIVSGRFDTYITAFAVQIRNQSWPVAIRFAHEMNGSWYPWSERHSGNRPGDYVAAWRHIHDVFERVGATNVIWIWSPNILRGAPHVDLRPLYPGDDYVDWVGMVGYAVEESTAAQVFEPTMAAIRTFTQKPLLITETGVQRGPHQLGWVADFFRWLSAHHDVIGFIWFEFDHEQGGSSDWRITASRALTAAVKKGMATLTLAPPPRH